MRIPKALALTTLSALYLTFSPSLSRADVCISDFKKVESSTRLSYYDAAEEARLYQAGLTCQELAAWQMGLKAASYTFNVVGLGLACTQVGTPVSIGMFGVGYVLYSADLIVSSLPCESGTQAETEGLIRKEVCKALTAQGIECDPKAIRRQ